MCQAKLRKNEIDALKAPTIRPVMHITREFWEHTMSLFVAAYRTIDKRGGRLLPYDRAATYRKLACAWSGDQLVGFVLLFDLQELMRYAQSLGCAPQGLTASIWHPDRASNLNTRQIEAVWVHHRWQHKGLATRLYQYALGNMGATHIHIDPDRVWDAIPYWRGLGFDRAMLYRVGDDDPSCRLHIPHADPHLWPLTRSGLVAMYADRDLQIPLTGRQRKIAQQEVLRLGQLA